MGCGAVDIALSSRALIPVEAETISGLAFPCCRRGEECCPVDPGGRRRECCTHAKVHQWMQRIVREGGSDLQFVTRTTWYDQKWATLTPASHRVQRQLQNRSLESAGLSYLRIARAGRHYEPVR